KVPTSPRLRVLEARLEDVESGIVRVSATVMQRLSLLPGDVVMIQGERQCLARVHPFEPPDEQPSAMRLDGLLRENAGVTLDERIPLSPPPVPRAGVLLLAPQERLPLGGEEVRRIGEYRAGRALMRGERVTVPFFSRRNTPFTVSGYEPD